MGDWVGGRDSGRNVSPSVSVGRRADEDDTLGPGSLSPRENDGNTKEDA